MSSGQEMHHAYYTDAETTMHMQYRNDRRVQTQQSSRCISQPKSHQNSFRLSYIVKAKKWQKQNRTTHYYHQRRDRLMETCSKASAQLT